MTEADSPPAAPRAGADLRAARDRLGWPIEAVAAALRIRQPHLEALEDGRIDLLPGNAYAVGFLRTYAKALGLDPDEIVRRFKAEASEVTRRTELVFPAPMPQRGLPAGAVVLLGVVLAIGAYAGWYRLSGEGRLPAETVAPVPQRLASLAEQAVPTAAPARTAGLQGPAAAGPDAVAPRAGGMTGQPGTAAPADDAAMAASVNAAGQPGSAAPSGAATAPPGSPGPQSPAGAGAANPVLTAAAGPNAAPQATEQPPAPPVPAISPTSAAAASVPLAMAGPAASAPAGAPAAPIPDPSQIVLKATADAWVQVRDRTGGGVLLNRILHSGDSWPVPTRPNLVLTTGNAGGTELVVDGETMQVPGGPGAVRRDLPLDAELIKDGGLAQLSPVTVPGGASFGAAASGSAVSGSPASSGAASATRAAQPGGSRPATQ